MQSGTCGLFRNCWNLFRFGWILNRWVFAAHDLLKVWLGLALTVTNRACAICAVWKSCRLPNCARQFWQFIHRNVIEPRKQLRFVLFITSLNRSPRRSFSVKNYPWSLRPLIGPMQWALSRIGPRLRVRVSVSIVGYCNWSYSYSRAWICIHARDRTHPRCVRVCNVRWRKVFRIGTVRYNWTLSAHASQTFSIAHCTDSEDLPRWLLTLYTMALPRALCSAG